jgi:hypothetical protein
VPALVVCSSNTTPVSSFFASIFALTTMAPEESVTAPVMDEVLTCAETKETLKSSKTTAVAAYFLVMEHPPFVTRRMHRVQVGVSDAATGPCKLRSYWPIYSAKSI